ncbi:uncharacterized protein F4812DRAFT_231331 [Daldinia caldariorum]|uniref:uncharacterized protein n=1 Tax=Daldinia caldariorum TaxID=326644 RepID=UPI002007368C|nr:uncharacterized protein F4812DRAFT_231331 [Daldinia caldariorum]KAI1463792.1 hypothetical protein F4812DRAFT_231331 [Daldinia caldariorum]
MSHDEVIQFVLTFHHLRINILLRSPVCLIPLSVGYLSLGNTDAIILEVLLSSSILFRFSLAFRI